MSLTCGYAIPIDKAINKPTLYLSLFIVDDVINDRIFNLCLMKLFRLLKTKVIVNHIIRIGDVKDAVLFGGFGKLSDRSAISNFPFTVHDIVMNCPAFPQSG